MPKTVSATEARIHLGDAAQQLAEMGETIIVERSGSLQAVMLPRPECEHLVGRLDEREAWEIFLDTDAGVYPAGPRRCSAP